MERLIRCQVALLKHYNPVTDKFYFGGWGLNIKTEDIARFGQLYLQKGHWNGRQLVPVPWVDAATSKQIANGPDKNPDWEQGYGYQFWRCQPAGMYRGDGAFGQFCVVMPEQDAVLAITTGSQEMQPILKLVWWEKLLPGFRAGELPANAPAAGELAETVSRLRLVPPKGGASSPSVERVSGRVYRFDPNPASLHSLRLDFSAKTLTYRLLGGGERRGTYQLSFGLGDWVDGGSSSLWDFIPRMAKACKGSEPLYRSWFSSPGGVSAICAYLDLRSHGGTLVELVEAHWHGWPVKNSSFSLGLGARLGQVKVITG